MSSTNPTEEDHDEQIVDIIDKYQLSEIGISTNTTRTTQMLNEEIFDLQVELERATYS
ncbi:MAG: hypothetical protein AAF939_08825 [Planctomycetota bacterium]